MLSEEIILTDRAAERPDGCTLLCSVTFAVGVSHDQLFDLGPAPVRPFRAR